MSADPPHITLRIEHSEPIEIGDFVGVFTSLASEFDRFVRQKHPEWNGSAQFFVREMRHGSIEADLLPYIAVLAPLLGHAENLMFIEDFVRRWGGRLSSLILRRDEEQPTTRAELRDFTDAVKAIANDPDGSATLEAATFLDGKRQVIASFKFTTAEARNARAELERKHRELEHKSRADHERVLMVFVRSDVRDAEAGKRSGELVRIEELSPRALSLIYASQLAEDRIKAETRAEESVFKKGFVVDVSVRLTQGRPAAYAVTNVHQVIDLPDDDED